MLDLEKLIKIAMNLFSIQKMEDEIKNTEQIEMIEMIPTSTESGTELAGRESYESSVWNPSKFKLELQVLAWDISLGPGHPDFGFFRGGECNKCSGCSDEFNFLHYTSERNAYCVRCYLDGFCTVIDDDTIFRVVIRKTKRILIEIHNPNK